ncbi:hypothetical protein P8918_13330 [Bacillus spizizenii]|nr:hypothetical protein [Bacillus spizizenii]MCY8890550.1 hypothetical protein [Bacillus spizizenii]MEC0842009.1 hypothetical protein [Bacillus spizizenii]
MAIIRTTGSITQKQEAETAKQKAIDKLLLNPPQLPGIELFTKPEPRFEHNLEQRYKFGYFFGVDNVSFSSRNINTTCGRVTDYIEIGNVESIQLESSYHLPDKASVEFSVIDQDVEIPIVPVGDSLVRNEKIFFGLPLRFSIDKTKPYIIKKDGVEVTMTPEAAINANDGLYTITYSPIGAYDYMPKNDRVKVKVIMRLYDKTSEPPFVQNALIRAYGGDALWKDRL